MASSTDSDVECECSHLTSFTILLVSPGYLPLMQGMLQTVHEVMYVHKITMAYGSQG